MKYSGFASFGWKNLGLFVCFWGGRRASATRLRKTKKKLEENQKKTKKTKKTKSWEKCCTQRFPSGDCFFCFFCYFGFFEGNGYRAEKNQKNSKKTKKKSKKTKNQSLGRNVVPKDFLQGIVFFVILVFFRHFLGFLVHDFVRRISDLRIKTTILGRDKNQNHPMSTERTQCKQETPHNYSMEITRAHRVPFSFLSPSVSVDDGITT